jgi:Na+(H+)/acetate symporter ActP
VFVFYLFVQPPLLFERAQLDRIQSNAEYSQVAKRFEVASSERRGAALALAAAHHAGDTAAEREATTAYRAAQHEIDAAHERAEKLVELSGGEKGFKDTNYIFLTFVTHYLPVGLVGLVIAVIFAATMSASSGEINSLATVTLVDIYRRHIRRGASDHHYVMASRVATLFWGVYAVMFAGWGKKLGSLIVAVNVVGSLFYGSLLGCFVLAFGFRRVKGTATFIGMLAGEAAVLSCFFFNAGISWLWYNVIGCGVVVITALAITYLGGASSPKEVKA